MSTQIPTLSLTGHTSGSRMPNSGTAASALKTRFPGDYSYKMGIPVYELGTDPHITAPIFHAKNMKALRKGGRKQKIKRIGDHYFAVKSEKHVPGPRPEFKEKRQPSQEIKAIKLPRAEGFGLRFQQTDQMLRESVEAQLRGIDRAQVAMFAHTPKPKRFLSRMEIRTNLSEASL